MRSPWWHEPFRGVQTNLREIDADLDVEAVLDFIEDYGADTWLLSVGGIIANYPSELDCQTVNPALAARASGDLIGDAVSAARRRGIRVLARMDFSKVDARRAEEHPEWCFVGPDGRAQIYNGYRSVCPSGEYYQRKMFDVVAEVLSRYDVAGFFFNMMHFNERDYSRRYHGVCHCTSCLSAFRSYAPDVEHPTGPDSPGYQVWRSWSAGVLDDLNTRMREHISELDRDVALMLRESAHITYHEANNAVGRPLWHHLTSESVSAHRSRDRDRTVYVNCTAFVDMPYRWAGEDPNHVAQYLLQAMAHGGHPSTYLMGTPETTRYEGLEVGRSLTRFHRDHASLYAGLRSGARVGLVRPHGGSHDARRLAEFRGWYQCLVEQHVPFDVLEQSALEGIDPQQYDLVILADLGPLAPHGVAGVESLLEQGSAVVATGDSAWSRGELQVPGAGSLARWKAEYTTEESLFGLHIPVDSSGDYVPAVGGFGVLEPSSEAEVDWRALGRALYGPPEKCYGHVPVPHPGWVAGRVGRGRLAVVPWRPGQLYHELGLTRVRDAVVAKVFTLTRSGRQVEAELPAQVQVVLGTNRAGATVVHLLNRSGDAPQRFVEPVPVPAGRLRVRTPADPVIARAQVSSEDLSWHREGDVVVFRTPRVGLFEVLEIQWSNN